MEPTIIRHGPKKKELKRALFFKNVEPPPSVHLVLFDQEQQCTIERDLLIVSCTRTQEPNIFDLTGYLDHDLTVPETIDIDWDNKVKVNITYDTELRSGRLQFVA